MATASITNLELTTTAIVNNLIKHKLANLDNIYNEIQVKNTFKTELMNL